MAAGAGSGPFFSTWRSRRAGLDLRSRPSDRRWGPPVPFGTDQIEACARVDDDIRDLFAALACRERPDLL